MCLDELEYFKPCKVGYKLMQLSDGKLHGEFIMTTRARPMGVWLNEQDYREKRTRGTISIFPLEKCPSTSYKKGWHIFNSKSEALQYLRNRMIIYGGALPWVIVRVLVRKPVATGTQKFYWSRGCSKLRITVAQEMKITSVLDE